MTEGNMKQGIRLRRCVARIITLALGIISQTAMHAATIDFDNVVGSSGGTAVSSETFAANGVRIFSGNAPTALAVGSIFTFTGLTADFLIIESEESISAPNLARAKGVPVGFEDAKDLLLEFGPAVNSVQITLDENPSEAPSLVRLLALVPTGNPLEFQVVALDEAFDDAVSSPANLTNLEIAGAPFSYVLFQTTAQDSEGIDNLTFGQVPEPSITMMLTIGSAALVLLRRSSSRAV
jgi:hypothetical protein